VPAALPQPPLEFIARDVEVDEDQLGGRGAQAVPVGPGQRRAAEHRAVPRPGQRLGEPIQPRRAVGVGERVARAHGGDVGGRMEVVALEEGQAERRRQPPSDRRLARAGHAHHHHAQRCRLTGHRAIMPATRAVVPGARCLSRPSRGHG